MILLHLAAKNHSELQMYTMEFQQKTDNSHKVLTNNMWDIL